jgi:hypothetical protein
MKFSSLIEVANSNSTSLLYNGVNSAEYKVQDKVYFTKTLLRIL